jgi:hypothetical protein
MSVRDSKSCVVLADKIMETNDSKYNPNENIDELLGI